VDWINSNVRTKEPRPIGQKHIWICGESECGKSSVLFRVLFPNIRTLDILDNNGWLENYRDGCYDLLYIDELEGSEIRLSQLKRLSGGHPVNCYQRAKRPALKKDNLPIYITCQETIRDAFPNISRASLFALERRFIELHVTEPLRTIRIKPRVSD